MAGQGLVFKKVNWSSEVAANLAKSTYPEQNFIAKEVQQGISECWHIQDCGYVVTRLEIEPDKRILVMVAGQGKQLAAVMKVMPAVAKANGASEIRLHSRRAGMVRMLEKLGYKTVYGLGENVFYGRV